MPMSSPDELRDHGHDGHEEHRGHGHMHGAVDPVLATSARGIWAIKWSFVGLFATALFQVVVVYFSGSVALLADTIHNFGDALRLLIDHCQSPRVGGYTPSDFPEAGLSQGELDDLLAELDGR